MFSRAECIQMSLSVALFSCISFLIHVWQIFYLMFIMLKPGWLKILFFLFGFLGIFEVGMEGSLPLKPVFKIVAI